MPHQDEFWKFTVQKWAAVSEITADNVEALALEMARDYLDERKRAREWDNGVHSMVACYMATLGPMWWHLFRVQKWEWIIIISIKNSYIYFFVWNRYQIRAPKQRVKFLKIIFSMMPLPHIEIRVAMLSKWLYRQKAYNFKFRGQTESAMFHNDLALASWLCGQVADWTELVFFSGAESTKTKFSNPQWLSIVKGYSLTKPTGQS